MSNSIEMIKAAVAGNALRFQELFDQEIGSRIDARVDELKPEVAASLFGQTTQEEE